MRLAGSCQTIVKFLSLSADNFGVLTQSSPLDQTNVAAISADLIVMVTVESPRPPPQTTVLLAEDSKFLRLVNTQTLSRAGYKVLAAIDGEETVRITRESLPDLIVLDMLLPKLPGLEVLRILKQDPATCHIPIIVLSSLSKTNEERLRVDGAAEFVEKSALENDKAGILLKAVDRVLRSVAAL